MLYNNYGMMNYGWGWLMMLCIVILIVLGIIALIRYLQQTSRTDKQHAVSHTALDILNERYAKGEISDEEYEAKKSKLLK